MIIKNALPSGKVFFITAATLVLFSFSSSVSFAQGVFGGGSSSGGGVFGQVRSFFNDSIETIFDNLGVGVPGGAVIPGITPVPDGGAVTLPSGGLPPVFDPSKKIKVTFEWDAVSVGPEAVDPKQADPLEKEHKEALACPPCPARIEASPNHEGETWHYCAVQPPDMFPGCAVSDIKHVLYGWCGHRPEVLDGARTPGVMKKAYAGPNSYTLPAAVSNKYIRRDGYAYRCVRTCESGICEQDNYMEFQTMIYHSNAISMNIRIENLTDTPLQDVVVKVSNLSFDDSVQALPHNVDYPIGGSSFGSGYVHGNNLEEVNLDKIINGNRMRITDDVMYFGPFHMDPHGMRYIPLTPSANTIDEVPSASLSVNIGENSFDEVAAQDTNVSDSIGSGLAAMGGLVDSIKTGVEWLMGQVGSIITLDTVMAYDIQGFNECAGQALADYLNTLIDAKQSGQISSNVQIGTPIFNLTNTMVLDGVTDGGGLLEQMAAAGANFDQVDTFIGTAYNIGPGQGMSSFVNNFKQYANGKPIVLAEIGAIEQNFAGVSRGEAVEHMRTELEILANDPQVQSMSLFASFSGRGPGWGNPDSNFSYNWFSDGEIDYMSGLMGGNKGKLGINPGSFIGDGATNIDMVSAHASSQGMGNVVVMARNSDPQMVADELNAAIAAGLTPTLRIGTETDAGGFTDPQVYADFLAALGPLVNGSFIASGGPNEPDRSHWFAPECAGMINDLVNPDGDGVSPPDIYDQKDVDPGDEIDPEKLEKPLGEGSIVPRDFNFVCEDYDDMEDDRCDGAGKSKGYIIDEGSEEFYKFRDVTAIGGCGYQASSNNSVIGPMQIVAEYGGTLDESRSRSVLLAAIPVGGRITDDQSRPYGWPASGIIEQGWGFTGQANSEGYYRSNPSIGYGEFRCCGVCTSPTL